MDESLISKAQSLTPEGIQKLQQLKAELESLSSAIQNMENKSKYEVEDRIRAFQEKEAEIKSFLRELGMIA
jgi:DNA-binding PadR family transcriptional regulator